ncbi:hypothetical protein B566_EDAN018552 [Ephemera danica]|nr:hypothetical protein B566_EDAN018552 [Ephemera danica]
MPTIDTLQILLSPTTSATPSAGATLSRSNSSVRLKSPRVTVKEKSVRPLFVGHTHDGDLRFIAGEGNARHDSLFHGFIFLKGDQCSGGGLLREVDVPGGETAQHPQRHAVLAGKFHRANLQHLRAHAGHFQHLFEAHAQQAPGLGHDARISGVDAVHIGGGHVALRVHALKAGDDDHPAGLQIGAHLGVVNAFHPRLGVGRIGANRHLPAAVADRRHAFGLQRQGQQAHRHLFAGAGNLIQFAQGLGRARIRQQFLGQAEQTIRLAAHGRGHHHHLVPGAGPFGDALGDIADALALGRNDGVHRELQHQHLISHADGQRATGAAFANDGGNDGHFQLRHLEDVAANGFRLAALLCANAWVGARRVHEGEHRQMKLLGQLHQPQRLAVALGPGHAEIAQPAFLRIAPLLVPQHHAGLAIEAGHAADDGQIISVVAITMQFMEIGEAFAYVVQRVGPLRVAGDLRHLPGRQARIDFLARKLAHGEVDVTLWCAVGQALGFQAADKAEHLRHVLRGTRLVRGPLDAQRIDVHMHRRDHLVGERANRHAALQRAANDLVIDVGDVANVGDLIARHQQPPVQKIKGHHHAGMAHMAQVVDRHAAHIHADVASLQRREQL